ncbi:MAG: hypothetical protein AAFQ82_26620, partial [Myxococcota bacterium]
MPAVFNFGAHVLLGSFLALSARNSERFRQELVSWPLILLFGFHALVAAPSGTYLFRFFPQWSMLYAFDPQVVPELEDWIGLLSGGVVLLNLVCGVFGLVVTRLGVLRGSRALEILPISLALLSWALLFTVYGERTFWVGTYDAYWQDEAALLFTTLPGILGLGTYLAGIGFIVWIR